MFMLIIWTKILLIYIGFVCLCSSFNDIEVDKKNRNTVLFLKILKDLETYNAIK